MTSYDESNIFCKFIKNEINVDKFHETKHSFSFLDKYPKYKTHILLIPKGFYTDIYDFESKANQEEKLDFWQCFKETIEKANLYEHGFRTLSNCKDHGSQQIFHFHLHILGGETIKLHKDL